MIETVSDCPNEFQGRALSTFQQDVLRYFLNETGDLFVNAVAGSGKTFTLVMLASHIQEPDRADAIFVAFNKSVAVEIGARLPAGMRASTCHSLGFAALGRHYGRRPAVDDRKYWRLLDYWYASNNVDTDSDEMQEERTALKKLISLTMLTLADPHNVAALDRLCMSHDINLAPEQMERYQEMVETILEWGVSGTPTICADGKTYAGSETISYDDMVYLPAILPLVPWGYLYLFIDESQDLNNAQLTMLLKHRAFGGRIFFVGDVRQAIYGFAGANAAMYDEIQRRTGAAILPLSVCYRCSQAQITLAQQIVSWILPKPDIDPGWSGKMERAQFYEMLQEHPEREWMILCRCTKPLIAMCYELIARGVPAKVRGRDIGEGLCQCAEKIGKLKGFEMESFPAYAEEWRAKQLVNLANREGSEMQQVALSDRVDTLLVVYQQLAAAGAATSLEALISGIKSLFEEGNCKVMLSTIHKAKGLEARRVAIIDHHKMPHPMARGAAQLIQEDNLRYVAYTRSSWVTVLIEED